jgi:hypothetical protein
VGSTSGAPASTVRTAPPAAGTRMIAAPRGPAVVKKIVRPDGSGTASSASAPGTVATSVAVVPVAAGASGGERRISARQAAAMAMPRSTPALIERDIAGTSG